MKISYNILFASICGLAPMLTLNAAAGPGFSERRTVTQENNIFQAPKVAPGGPIETNEERQWAQGNPPKTSTTGDDVRAREDFQTATTPASSKEELIASQQNAIPPRALQEDRSQENLSPHLTSPSSVNLLNGSQRDTTEPNTPRSELSAQGINPNLIPVHE